MCQLRPQLHIFTSSEGQSEYTRIIQIGQSEQAMLTFADAWLPLSSSVHEPVTLKSFSVQGG